MAVDAKALASIGDNANLIGGKWVSAISGETFDVLSPATGEVLASVPKCGKADVDAAVDAAAKAWTVFKDVPLYVRADALRRMAELIRERTEEIALVLSMEQGKPYETEAFPEVEETAFNFQIFAEGAASWEGPTIPFRDPNIRAHAIYSPYGVVAIISPWNFPVMIPAEYIAPALLTGNTVISKPASTTPLSMILTAQCIQQALDEFGFPGGVFSLLTGPGGVVGEQLVTHPQVDLIGLTGETITGEEICSKAGIKKTLMELGGNGPQIVCDDADLREAAKAAALGCFYNAGQVCCATERILVQESVHDEFVKLMLEELANWKLGDPLDAATTVGPMNNAATVAKVEEHLADAVSKGATVLAGGGLEDGRPTRLYFQPTVVDGVGRNTLLNMEETFGPVAPIFTFKTDAEAVEIAHESGYGLVMAVFTSSLKRSHYYVDQLRTGNIVVNQSTDYWEAHLPFGGGGGTKSGHGRLGMRFALEDLTYLKMVTVDIAKCH